MADPQLTDYDVLAPSQQGPIPPAVSMPGDKDTVKLPSQSDVQNYLTKRQQLTDTTTQRMEDLDKRQLDLAMKPTPQVPVPKYQNIPTPPQDNYRSVFKESQAGLIFATIMGAMASRKHGIGAMEAATGYMEGFHKGDKEKMDRERQKWEDNVTAIRDQNAIEKERYDAVWNNAQLSMHDKQAQIQALAASFGHQQVIDALRTGNMDLAIKIPTDVYNASQRIGIGLKASPQNISRIAEGIESGMQPPSLTGFYGLSGPVRAQLEADGFDLSKAQMEWEQAKKQVSSLNGPQMTRYVGLANGITATIDRVEQLAQEMRQNGVPAWNHLELLRFVQTNGNSPKGQLATRYITAVGTLKEEFANLANGGYAPTEPAWALANQQIDGNYGVDQLSGSLDEVKRAINYRISNIPGMNTVGPGAGNRYTGSQGAPKSDEPVKVKTPEEAEKLAPGTKYITPDGHEYTR